MKCPECSFESDSQPKYTLERCVLCGDPVDPESPTEALYDHSPRTFRRGWQHPYCNQVAVEELETDRRDAYYQL